MKLKEVKIGYADSCITYALRRIGVDPYENKLVTSSSLLDSDLFKKMDFCKDLLKKGDLGFWDREDKTEFKAARILADGRIITEKVEMPRHVAVWEGDCWSHYREIDRNHPVLMLEKELKRDPDFILRLK